MVNVDLTRTNGDIMGWEYTTNMEHDEHGDLNKGVFSPTLYGKKKTWFAQPVDGLG